MKTKKWTEKHRELATACEHAAFANIAGRRRVRDGYYALSQDAIERAESLGARFREGSDLVADVGAECATLRYLAGCLLEMSAKPTYRQLVSGTLRQSGLEIEYAADAALSLRGAFLLEREAGLSYVSIRHGLARTKR